MKECEIFSNLKVPCGSKIILRLDGRGFYRLSQLLKLQKPYDHHFVEAMVNTAKDIISEFSPTFIYTFSDEFNILLDDILFAGRIEKLNSVFASFIATSFHQNLTKKRFKYYPAVDNENHKDLPLISFDSRIIPLPSELLNLYFRSRQDEAWRNCLNGYAYWTLRKEMDKEEAMQYLMGLKSSGIHDLLFKKGINISEVPAWQRRGIGIYKEEAVIKGYNPLQEKEVYSTRKKIISNWDLPLFNQEFFENMDWI